MAFDQNGLPTIEGSDGAFETEESLNRLKGVDPGQVSFASLLESAMAIMSEPISFVVDPFNRKVYSLRQDNFNEATAIPHSLASIIKPETGQTGRSLKWEAGSDTGAGVPNKAEYVATTEAVKPSRSASSQLAALLAAIPYGTAEADVPLIHVNQFAGTIKLIKPTNRATAVSNLNALSPGSGYVRIALSEPEGGSNVTPLVFEGGATD